jgi:hypothetical protein
VRVPAIPPSRPHDQAGAVLLGELHAALCRYVALPSAQAADAVTLWVAATHAQPAWEHAPRLAVVSPLKRCGKSRLLDVVAETCHAPLITVNATIAAVVRSLGEDPPTLLVDEADTLWGTKKQADQHEDLRGLLNAGHQRNRPMLRWDVTTRTLEQLGTFAMAMLAAIGDLPDTIMDRAVVVRMRRRGPGEHVDPYRTRRDAPPLNQLRDRLGGWTRAHLGELQHAAPQMPLEDRAADTWEPLIAVADLAQGDWPTRARTAATTMTSAEAQHEEDTSASVRLLGDLRGVFGDAEALYSTTILDRLHKLDDAPWGDWYGRPLSTRDLAKLLRPYDVRAKNVRERGGEPRKGYTRADLHEPWARYVPLPPLPPSQPDEPAGQPGRGRVADHAPPSATSATPPGPVADVADRPDPSATGLTSQGTDVAEVAHTPGSNGAPAAGPHSIQAEGASHPAARRVAPGSVWARNGAPQLAPDPDRFTQPDHDTASPPDDPGRWTPLTPPAGPLDR